MKFCSFSIEGESRFGFELEPGRLVDLKEAGEELVRRGLLEEEARPFLDVRDLKGYLSRGSSALSMASKIGKLLLDTQDDVDGIYHQNQIRLLAPISNPGKIIAIGLNYRDHAKEQGAKLPENPRVFAKFPSAVIGPEEPIKLPSISKKVDVEAELCVVILERCKRISRDDAKHVVAYMVGNDVSARDLQYSDKQWVRGKSCDTFAPCGPFLVTADEVGNPHELSISLERNGEIQQSSNTRELIFDSFDLIEFITRSSTLEPGDIIFTGTPSGVGVFRDPPVFVQPGDIIEVKIDKLGTLRNPVVSDV